jgi:hypothetical protein
LIPQAGDVGLVAMSEEEGREKECTGRFGPPGKCGASATTGDAVATLFPHGRMCGASTL